MTTAANIKNTLRNAWRVAAPVGYQAAKVTGKIASGLTIAGVVVGGIYGMGVGEIALINQNYSNSFSELDNQIAKSLESAGNDAAQYNNECVYKVPDAYTRLSFEVGEKSPFDTTLSHALPWVPVAKTQSYTVAQIPHYRTANCTVLNPADRLKPKDALAQAFNDRIEAIKDPQFRDVRNQMQLNEHNGKFHTEIIAIKGP